MFTENLVWQKDILLAPYSTFKIGGLAKYFVKVNTPLELSKALKYCFENNIKYYFLGKGSNTLFDDRGFNGAVILVTINHFKQQGSRFDVGAGFSFSLLGIKTAKLGFSGLEYASGIPGSLGGAIYMNAGANGQEIAPLVKQVDYVHQNGEIEVLAHKEIKFFYRSSCFHEKKGAIAKAVLELKPSTNARKHQVDLIHQRKLSQPLNEPSCGCIFKNLEGVSIGALMEQMGLKGLSVGGAQVSLKHANFIVNKGLAKAQDVKDLVDKIQKMIYLEKGLILKREVRFVSYEGELVT